MSPEANNLGHHSLNQFQSIDNLKKFSTIAKHSIITTDINKIDDKINTIDVIECKSHEIR